MDEIAPVAWERSVAEELGHASCLGKVLAGGVELSDRLVDRHCVIGDDFGKILVELGVGSDVAFYEESGLVGCIGDNESVWVNPVISTRISEQKSTGR